MSSRIPQTLRCAVAPLFSLVMIVFLSAPAWAWPDSGAPIAEDAPDQLTTNVVPDGHGGTFVLWWHSRSHPFFVQHLSPGGARTWGKNGVLVATPRQTQLDAKMVSDGQGGVIVAVVDGPTTVFQADLIVQRLSPSGKTLWGDAGIDLGTTVREVPTVVADGTGGAILPYALATENVDRAQHIGADGQLLWASPGIVLANLKGTKQLVPVAVGDGSGGMIVEWAESGISTARAQRISGDGSRLWSDDGILLPALPFAVASDEAHGFLMAWFGEFSRTNGYPVVMQRFNGNGAALWTPGGVIANGAGGGYREWIVIASDRAGGAFVSWNRSAVVNDSSSVFVQHIDASGSPRWTPGGVVASSGQTTTYEYARALGPDDSGGVFVVYANEVAADTSEDLFVRHLGSDGAPDAVQLLAHHATTLIVGASDDRGDFFAGWTTFAGSTYTLPYEGFVLRLPSRSSNAPTTLMATRTDTKSVIEEIAPNPARGAFRVSGALPSDTPARLELYDLRGRLVASRLIAPAGGAWSASIAEGERLRPGTYLLRVVQQSLVSTAKLSLIR